MTKNFDIHDWQDKQKHNLLTEHTVNFSIEDMETLHNDGKLIKVDDDGNENIYTFGDDLANSGDDKDFDKWVNDPYLEEQDNFDSRFKDAMGGAGFSDDEQDDIMSRDIGSPFPGSEDKDFDEDDVRAIEDKAIELDKFNVQRYMVDIILPIDVPKSEDDYEDEKIAEKITDFYRKKMGYPEAYTGKAEKRLEL